MGLQRKRKGQGSAAIMDSSPVYMYFIKSKIMTGHDHYDILNWNPVKWLKPLTEDQKAS